jgi:uncharacterized RDD family membrane protein YckC
MKQPEDYALEYAGFWIRLGATLIDLVILLLVIFPVYISFSPNHSVSFTNISLTSIVIFCVLGLMIKIAYFVVFWVWKGQTPGKMALGIKVIRTKNNQLDWTHSFLRYAGYVVCALTVFLGFILIAFDSHKQGLHDRIADTYVVKLPVRQVVLTGNLARGRVG